MNLSDDQLSALLRDTAPAPRLRPAADFWADTLRRAREEEARDRAARRRFARRSRFAAAAAAAAAIVAAAGLFAGLPAGAAPAPGSSIESFELDEIGMSVKGAGAAGAAVLADADSSAQILWILTD